MAFEAAAAPQPRTVGGTMDELQAAAAPDPSEMASNQDVPLLVDGVRESTLHKTFLERFADGRDMRVIISADNSATGVGKTTAAVVLAKMWDLWGWDVRKATLDPREYAVLYNNVYPGSVLILDEAEKALERRRSMSNEVLDIGHDFAANRYRQVFGIMTLPSKDMMDARIADKLCDFWILVQDTGKAAVFKFEENQFTGKVYTKKVETFEWPALDDDRDFQALETKKHERQTNQTQARYIHRSEFEEAKENFWNKASAKTRFDLLSSIYEAAQDSDSKIEVTQTELGEIADMSQSNVSKIVNSDEFEDFYSSFDEEISP